MKKFKVHRERVKEYFERRKEEKRQLILAKKNAKAKNSAAAQAGNYNRPRDDDLEVLDEAFELARRKRGLSPTNTTPDTMEKRQVIPWKHYANEKWQLNYIIITGSLHQRENEDQLHTTPWPHIV